MIICILSSSNIIMANGISVYFVDIVSFIKMCKSNLKIKLFYVVWGFSKLSKITYNLLR